MLDKGTLDALVKTCNDLLKKSRKLRESAATLDECGSYLDAARHSGKAEGIFEAVEEINAATAKHYSPTE